MQNNGSVWVHAVFTPAGASPRPGDDQHDRAGTFGKTYAMAKFLKKPKV